MAKENQDRQAVISKEIGLDSEEKRAAHSSQADGDNTELKPQAEEPLAAHRQSDKFSPAKVEAAPAKDRKPLGKWAQMHPRIVKASVLLHLLLLVAAVGSASLAVREAQQENQARQAEQQAVENYEKAQKDAEVAKGRLRRAEEAEQARTKEREEARAAVKEERRSADDAKAVLAFLQYNVFLAPGRPTSWSKEGLGKEVTLRKAVDAAASKLGGAIPDRPLVEASIREILGASYSDLGEAEQAVKQFERAFELRKEWLGPDDHLTGECRNKLAVAYRDAGRTDAASELFDLPSSSSSASALALEGSVLLSQKKPVEAELKLRECLVIRQRTQPDAWTTFHTMEMLGEALLEQKNFKGAEPLLLSGYEGMKQRESNIPSQDKIHLDRALERLVQLYGIWGRKDKAAKWRKELEVAKASKKP